MIFADQMTRSVIGVKRNPLGLETTADLPEHIASAVEKNPKNGRDDLSEIAGKRHY